MLVCWDTQEQLGHSLKQALLASCMHRSEETPSTLPALAQLSFRNIQERPLWPKWTCLHSQDCCKLGRDHVSL